MRTDSRTHCEGGKYIKMNFYDGHLLFLLLAGAKKTMMAPQMPGLKKQMFNVAAHKGIHGLRIHLSNKCTGITDGNPALAYLQITGIETKLGIEITEEDVQREGFDDLEDLINWWDYHHFIIRRMNSNSKYYYFSRCSYVPIDIVHVKVEKITLDGWEFLGKMKDACLLFDYNFYREVISVTEDGKVRAFLESANKQGFLVPRQDNEHGKKNKKEEKEEGQEEAQSHAEQ